MDIKLPFKEPLPETILAVSTALKAGEAVLSVYNRLFSSGLKEDNEPITEADLKSQEIIQDSLSKMSYPIISEESKDMEGLKHDETWIVDPLDGTSDFISRTGEFSVMISFVRKHVPIIGVVYQPTEGLLYLAQSGGGAYMIVKGKWSKLYVNKESELHKCRAIVSRQHLMDKEKLFLEKLKVKSFIQKGSCGLKVAEICKGEAELYFTMTDKIKQWDTCAACCLIREAGGKMTDMLGNELEYNNRVINHPKGILVTNGAIHNLIIERYKSE